MHHTGVIIASAIPVAVSMRPTATVGIVQSLSNPTHAIPVAVPATAIPVAIPAGLANRLNILPNKKRALLPIQGEFDPNGGPLGGNKRRRATNCLPFEEARAGVRNLKLRNQREWWLWSKNRRPNNVPAAPNLYYRELGWVSWPDWLGYKGRRVVRGRRTVNYLSFEKARAHMVAQNLKNVADWHKWSKTRRPTNIPANPNRVYRDKGWQSMPHWLGYQGCTKNCLPFQQARNAVRALKLTSVGEWQSWARGPARPQNIPISPNRFYVNSGWVSFPDWLGYEPRAGHPEDYPGRMSMEDLSDEQMGEEFGRFLEDLAGPGPSCVEDRMRLQRAFVAGARHYESWKPISNEIVSCAIPVPVGRPVDASEYQHAQPVSVQVVLPQRGGVMRPSSVLQAGRQQVPVSSGLALLVATTAIMPDATTSPALGALTAPAVALPCAEL